MRLVDTWIATKFRGAQLLVDSVRAETASLTSFPRVEVIRAARTGDTLLALHFGLTASAPALRTASVVRLADATGAITLLSARIVARRLFRAPRIPNARVDADSAWRIGWAYAAVVQAPARGGRNRAERAWLLVDMADSIPRRPAR